MAYLPEVSQWEAGIYQLEEEDWLRSGPGEIDNVQANQLANRTRYLYDEQAYGYARGFLAQPSALQLATWRFLPLAGQVIPIASYQRLCDMMYVGDALNDTADWWYKTSDAAGNNRNVTGAYMRVLDHRGVFDRPAGQNSKYTMANGAPYDGGAIGGHIPDKFQGHWHLGLYLNNPATVWIAGGSGGTRDMVIDEPNTGGSSNYFIGSPAVDSLNDYGTPRVGSETNPASLSSYLCIKY
jgi:hypothetical protein